MASNVNIALATQWATQSPGEVFYMQGVAVPANFTSIALTEDADSTFLGTYACGSAGAGSPRGLRYTTGAATDSARIQIGSDSTSNNEGCVTFFWRPNTDAGGAGGNTGIVGFENDAVSGWMLGIDKDGKLITYVLAGDGSTVGTVYSTPILTTDTQDLGGGVFNTNPWWCLQVRAYQAGAQRVSVRGYRWDETINAFPETPNFEYVGTVGTVMSAKYLRLGTYHAGTAGNTNWDIGNLFFVSGSGFWGPVGCSMGSGTVDAGVDPVSDQLILHPSDAGSDSGTATSYTTTTLTDTGKAWTDNQWNTGYEVVITGGTASGICRDITSTVAATQTIGFSSIGAGTVTTYKIVALTKESDDIAELVSDDADYLKNTTSNSTTLYQFHSVVNSIISGTPNILAVQGGMRYSTPAASVHRNLRIRKNGETGTVGKSRTATDGTATQHMFVCTSQKAKTGIAQEVLVGGTGGAWVAADIDTLELGFNITYGSAESRIYAASVTVAYGNDEPYAKVAYENSAKAKGTANPLALSNFDIGTGSSLILASNRLVIMEVAYDTLNAADYNDPTTEFPTYTSTVPTTYRMKLLQATEGTPGYAVYFLEGPVRDSGADFSIPNPGGHDLVVTVMSLSNVDQAYPFGVSTATLNEVLDASETGIDVTDGTQFRVGQVIRIEAEDMWITSIASNTLTVTRAFNQSTGVAHATGLPIYNAVDTDSGTGRTAIGSTASPKGGLSVGGIAYALLAAGLPTVTVATVTGSPSASGQPGSHTVRQSDQQGILNDIGSAISTRWAQEDGAMNFTLSGVVDTAWKSWAVGVNYATRPGSSAP